MIRDKARSDSKPLVAQQKLDAVMKSMRVVMRRYECSRTERRKIVGGHQVQAEAGENR